MTEDEMVGWYCQLKGHDFVQETPSCGFDPWVRKIPWRRAWQPTPVFLPEEPHGQRSLAGYSPWVAKSQTRLKRPSTAQRMYGDILLWV